MAKVSSIPESEQGGGSSVSEAEIVDAATILRGNPAAEVEMDVQGAFRQGQDEKSGKLARKRTTSAGGRAAEKLAELLGVERENVHTAVRQVEEGVYTYWLHLDAVGQDGLRVILAGQDEDGDEDEGDQD